MKSHITGMLLLVSLASFAWGAEPVSVGAGGYLDGLPPGVKGPPQAVYAVENLRPPYPTNDWWSSLLWLPLSQPQYPHPLAVTAQKDGLRVFFPGPSIHANKDGVFGNMPGGGQDDLVLGREGAEPFAEARVDAFSDWFVSVRFGQAREGFCVSYGHGCPYVYALYDGGSPQVTFARAPAVWAGNERTPALGITVGRSHYGLFGPSGSTWAGLGSARLTCRSGGKNYFSLAVLPDNRSQTLDLFARFAHAHVTGSTVAWSYDPSARVTQPFVAENDAARNASQPGMAALPSRAVKATFTFTTTPREGQERATLFALYPHQWRYAQADFVGSAYASVRGPMKLARGTSFTTTTPLPPCLPVLPRPAGLEPARMEQLLQPVMREDMSAVRDTYAEGKLLGKLATAGAVAEQYGLAAAKSLRERVRGRLEEWLSAEKGKSRPGRVFCYDKAWGTLIGLPPSYGSDTELNDHHFHYGYFLHAAAEVGRHDPSWLADQRWGGMIRLVIRDIASADRADKLFPFLRCFDPYAGHSWASGHAKFGDGNNQESSSEAMNAWYAVMMLGEVMGDRDLRDLGAWLYATEAAAIREYWFDVHAQLPPGSPEYLAMIWGGKGVYATWFSARPEHVLGINILPVTGGSLYLGDQIGKTGPGERADAAWQGLLKRTRGQINDWADIHWMYRALSDPADAARLLAAAGDGWKPEGGNSKANTVHWIQSLRELGLPDTSVHGDTPFSAVFRRGQARTYVAWNLGPAPRRVTFSDGQRLDVPARSGAVK